MLSGTLLVLGVMMMMMMAGTMMKKTSIVVTMKMLSVVTINMLSVVTFLPYYFPYNHSNISKVIDNEYHGGLSDDFFTILFPSHPFLSNISKVASNSPA